MTRILLLIYNHLVDSPKSYNIFITFMVLNDFPKHAISSMNMTSSDFMVNEKSSSVLVMTTHC